MSTQPASSPTPRRATKGERSAILFRVPTDLLSKVDAKCDDESINRNDAMVAAFTAWVRRAGSAAPEKPAKSPKPQPVPGTRLDKTQIGRRLTPKPKPDAKAAPAPAEEEAV